MNLYSLWFGTGKTLVYGLREDFYKGVDKYSIDAPFYMPSGEMKKGFHEKLIYCSVVRKEA